MEKDLDHSYLMKSIAIDLEVKDQDILNWFLTKKSIDADAEEVEFIIESCLGKDKDAQKLGLDLIKKLNFSSFMLLLTTIKSKGLSEKPYRYYYHYDFMNLFRKLQVLSCILIKDKPNESID